LSAGGGDALSVPDLASSLRDVLLPRATIITPNSIEAAALSGLRVTTRDEQKEVAVALAAEGPNAVLVTGGHLDGGRVTDVLFVDGELMELESTRRDVGEIHGTGCALSAAITALLARGEGIENAVRRARDLVADAIARATAIGKGARVLEVRA
jgi:hydroxymethylpyrimidine/phosphomethylpyrimidine kinase